jgi:hypothetical protein
MESRPAPLTQTTLMQTGRGFGAADLSDLTAVQRMIAALVLVDSGAVLRLEHARFHAPIPASGGFFRNMATRVS